MIDLNRELEWFPSIMMREHQCQQHLESKCYHNYIELKKNHYKIYYSFDSHDIDSLYERIDNLRANIYS